jgi:hypothetical protein
MQGLSPHANLAAMRDAELLQICIGKLQCILHFDRNIQLSVESSLELKQSTGRAISCVPYPKAASFLCSLLGQRLASAKRADDGGLLLLFTDGSTLTLFNDSDQYESFQLVIGDITHVA